jgi:hypothetical protein
VRGRRAPPWPPPSRASPRRCPLPPAFLRPSRPRPYLPQLALRLLSPFSGRLHHRSTASRGGAAATRRRSWPRLLRPPQTMPWPLLGASRSGIAPPPL